MDVDQKQSSAAPSSPEGRSSDASSETVGGRSSSKTARSGKQLKPGARTVQNLTKEQLERKRGNDREAQRAIRRRTKDLIKSLQNQVDDMKQSGNPQRVAHLVEERDRLIQENMALKGELQQRSEAGDSPSQVNPADTSSTGRSNN